MNKDAELDVFIAMYGCHSKVRKTYYDGDIFTDSKRDIASSGAQKIMFGYVSGEGVIYDGPELLKRITLALLGVDYMSWLIDTYFGTPSADNLKSAVNRQVAIFIVEQKKIGGIPSTPNFERIEQQTAQYGHYFKRRTNQGQIPCRF